MVSKMTVRIPEEFYRRVRAYAALEGKSVQDLVTELLEAKVPKQGFADPKRRTHG